MRINMIRPGELVQTVRDFLAPPGVVDVWIDADTGYRAGAECPHVMRESFIPTTEPRQVCTVLHQSSWFGTEQGDSTGVLPSGGPDDYGPDGRGSQENPPPESPNNGRPGTDQPPPDHDNPPAPPGM